MNLQWLLTSDIDPDSLPTLPDEKEMRWIREVYKAGRELEREDRRIKALSKLTIRIGDSQADIIVRSGGPCGETVSKFDCFDQEDRDGD